MALADDLRQRFPELDDEQIVTYTPILEPVYPAYFVGNYAVAKDREIILNLLAHLLIMETGNPTGAGVRTVVSRTVGSVSESYADNSSKSQQAEFFSSTKYGQRFLLLTSYRRGALVV